MPERSIAALQFGDKTIYVEVAEVQLEPETISPSGTGLPEHLEYTSGMAHLSPDEWKLEISLGFKTNSNIPFLAAGEGNGSVKVSATWKRAQE